MKRKVLRILGLILIAFLAWVVSQPLPARPDVSIKLLGYTNDSTCNRLAMITVTNLGNSTIFIYLPTIQIQAPSEPLGFTNYFLGNTNQWARFHTKLGKNESGNFAIPPPASTLQSPWRLSFNVNTDLGVLRAVKNILGGERLMPFQVQGDWLESEK